ncbi:MAG TPA: Hsp20/alpha crystallin family protein [Conexivisphaerales archaeon]|nr:Hsp20/alpha crystallin family protein [Conexivisphaerales archaeon]
MGDKDYRGLFDDMDDFMDALEKEVEGMLRQFRSSGLPMNRSITRGFTMEFGPGGEPFFRTFGDSMADQGSREPLIEQYVDKDALRVICEVPGVEKESIRLQATEDTVDISAETPERSYHANFGLKEPVDPQSSEARYNNGILEVRFKLRSNTNKGYKEIRIQ